MGHGEDISSRELLALASDYGHEAIATLLACKENRRDRLVVAAGYTEQMAGIFLALCAKHQIELHKDATQAMAQRIGEITKKT